MSFSSYKIIILNNGIEEGEKKSDDYINKKDVDFEKSCDSKVIFIKVYNSKTYNSFSSLNELRFSRNSKRINDLNS